MNLPPLVLIPGLNCTAKLFAPQIESLGRLMPVFVPDHTRDASMVAIAARVLAEAPPRFALAGLSMGGYIAFEILRQAQDRVMRLVLLDTNAVADQPERAVIRRGQVAEAKAGRFREVGEQLYPLYVHPARLEDRALRDQFLAMCEATGADGFERQIEAIIGRKDSLLFLRDIRVPTTVIVGADDQATPVSQAREITEGIPGASLHVVPHCGHLSTLEAPMTVTALMRSFLTARE